MLQCPIGGIGGSMSARRAVGAAARVSANCSWAALGATVPATVPRHVPRHMLGATASIHSTPLCAQAPPLSSTSDSSVRLTGHSQYNARRLEWGSLPDDPLVLFRAWLREAMDGDVPVREPEAMTLCTATPEGVPSARAVLLKEVDERGFVFYTNYNSRKARELTDNPHAALAFHWREIARQVRVVGPVEKVDRATSEEYFATRPRGSQIGAWASPQSQPVADGDLEAGVAQAEERFKDTDKVPCPPHWGGFRLVPTEVEFWAGQPSRLHDRFVYTRKDSNSPWTVNRLAP